MKPLGPIVAGIASGTHGEPPRRDPGRTAARTTSSSDVARAADLARPVPPLLASALKAVDGPIVPYRKADGTVGYRTLPMPEDRRGALEMARERRAALRAALARAPEDHVRGWCNLVATTTEIRDRGDGFGTLIDSLVLMFDLPTCCFTPESARMVAAEAATRDGWMPSYARMNPMISPLAVPLREELARIEKLIALLESPPPANLLSDERTADEVWTEGRIDGWIADRASEPAGHPRMVLCRAFLRRCAMTGVVLTDAQRRRIEALRDEPYGEDPSFSAAAEVSPERLRQAELAQEALRAHRERAAAVLRPFPAASSPASSAAASATSSAAVSAIPTPAPAADSEAEAVE